MYCDSLFNDSELILKTLLFIIMDYLLGCFKAIVYLVANY